MEKLIITVAPTGAITSRKETPYIPLTPKEIAEEVYECWKVGAAIVHIHVRDKNGDRTMNVDIFRETVELIRQKCDIIINLTASGGIDSEEERLGPIKLKPEMASYTAGSVNIGPDIHANPKHFLESLASQMLENGVKPEIEIFETGMINNALTVAKKGIIKAPFHFQFVLGVPGGMPATPKNLVHLCDSIPEGSTWSVAGIGRGNLAMTSMAIHMGGHVRVGMEDNVYLKRGVLAKSNADFVKRIKKMAEEFDRPVASANEAREILHLNK